MMSARTAESFRQQGAAIIERALSEYEKRAFDVKMGAQAAGQIRGSTRTLVGFDVVAAAVFESAAREFFATLQEANSAEASQDGDVRAEQLEGLLRAQLSALASGMSAALEHSAQAVVNVLANKAMAATALQQLPAVISRTNAELNAKVWIIASKAANPTTQPNQRRLRTCDAEGWRNAR